MSRLFDKRPPKTNKEVTGFSPAANKLVSRIQARLMTAKWLDTPERLAKLGITPKKSNVKAADINNHQIGYGPDAIVKDESAKGNYINRAPEILNGVDKDTKASEETFILNNKSESLEEHRIETAKKYEGLFSYSLNREKGSTNCADFITMVMLATDKEIAAHFVNTKNTSYSDVSTMRNAIINSLGGEIRKGDPKVGDIAIWWNGFTGHVEFVASVKPKEGKVYFTTFGAGSKKTPVPREMGTSKNGYPWLFVDSPDVGKLGQGGVFEGFWTPRNKQ